MSRAHKPTGTTFESAAIRGSFGTPNSTILKIIFKLQCCDDYTKVNNGNHHDEDKKAELKVLLVQTKPQYYNIFGSYNDMYDVIFSFISLKPFSHWDGLMKSYYKKHEEKCKYADKPVGRLIDRNEVKKYPTGSSYKGAVGMNGYGEYTYPNGILYRGQFYDGCFHGQGELVYKIGHREHTLIRGEWVHGVLTEHKVLLDGKLEYESRDWVYCLFPDRRYMVEFEKGLYPDGHSLITPDHPPRKIPPGYYDTQDGFYSPLTKTIYNHKNLTQVKRAPRNRERLWIQDYCRKQPLEMVGPRQDLYEKWVDPIMEPSPLPEPVVGFLDSESATSLPAYQETVDKVVQPVVYDSSKVSEDCVTCSKSCDHRYQ